MTGEREMYNISNPINSLDEDAQSLHHDKFFKPRVYKLQLTKTEHINEIYGLWLNGPTFPRYQWHDEVGPLLWRRYVRLGWSQFKFKKDFRILAALCGSKHPSQIILPDLWSFMDGKKIADTSKRCINGQIKSLFKSMRLLGIVPSDFAPEEELEKIKPKKLDPRPISPQDFKTLMTMTEAPFTHWFALGCMAGLRVAEIANLEGNWLELNHDGTYNLRVRGKGGTILVVPACDYLVEMIQSYNTQGRLWAVNAQYLCRLVNREMERVGVKPVGRSVISMHSTRHYFATSFLMASNKDWDATREVMRHSNLSTTQGYAGLVNDQNHAVVNKAFNQYKFTG